MMHTHPFALFVHTRAVVADRHAAAGRHAAGKLATAQRGDRAGPPTRRLRRGAAALLAALLVAAFGQVRAAPGPAVAPVDPASARGPVPPALDLTDPVAVEAFFDAVLEGQGCSRSASSGASCSVRCCTVPWRRSGWLRSRERSRLGAESTWTVSPARYTQWPSMLAARSSCAMLAMSVWKGRRAGSVSTWGWAGSVTYSQAG